ncbi:MAG: hypothetical protein WAM05_14540 [Candidatus Binataceae bacterium]
MKIESPILADAAQAANGKLFILGGGWSIYRSASYPVPVQLGLAFVVSLNANEVGARYPLGITIADEAGVPVVPPMQGQINVGPPAPGSPKGSPIKMPFAINIGVQVPRVGRYVIEIKAGSSKAQLEFDAIFVGTKVQLDFPPASGEEPGN